MDKTKLCKFFADGCCRRGRNCAFAHGEAELSIPPRGLKRQLCIDYFRAGWCRLGAACRYAHNPHEVESGSSARAKGDGGRGMGRAALVEPLRDEVPPVLLGAGDAVAGMKERIAQLQAQLEVMQVTQTQSGLAAHTPAGLGKGAASSSAHTFSRQTTAEGTASAYLFSRQTTAEAASSGYPLSRQTTADAAASGYAFSRQTTAEVAAAGFVFSRQSTAEGVASGGDFSRQSTEEYGAPVMGLGRGSMQVMDASREGRYSGI